MRVFSGYVGLAVLVSVTICAAQRPTLAFAGFSLDMNLAALLDRYPQSSHELTPTTGVRPRTSGDSLNGWIRQFFGTRGASGRYALRFTRGESHDHLYYVQADVREGTTRRLWLLLETPSELQTAREQAGHYETRYPACAVVLGPLTTQYGKPVQLPPRQEEAVESVDYMWTDGPETMKLQCGRYEGRRTVFAIGVTFERS